MRMYDCHVRLGNTTSSEVFKQGVTAAEIITLRHIHGIDAVVRVVPKNKGQASHAMERDRLRVLYESSEHQYGMIQHLFGPDHMPLPEELDPTTEAQAAAAVEATERAEAEKDADIEAEVDRRVKEQLAQLAAAKTDKEVTELINDPAGAKAELHTGVQSQPATPESADPRNPNANNGRLSDEEIASRAAKREAGHAKKFPKKQAESAEA